MADTSSLSQRSRSFRADRFSAVRRHARRRRDLSSSCARCRPHRPRRHHAQEAFGYRLQRRRGVAGLFAHFGHEWVLLANLFLLLVGFALLARHFEESRIPDWMPAALPDNWTGGLVLLVLVFVISSFLDNIAGALIGATVARHVFKGRVRIGYLAAIVAAANAGGAGSVIGDTTTTMLWIAGVSPLSLLPAYVGAVCALFVFGIPASLAQQKYAPIVKGLPSGLHISLRHVAVVIVVLASMIAVNVGAHLFDAHFWTSFPS